MALQHQQVYCMGELVWALDQANGKHRCPCGEMLTLVHTGPLADRVPFRPTERVLAGFDPDHRAEELEARNTDLSRTDFEQPFEAA